MHYINMTDANINLIQPTSHHSQGSLYGKFNNKQDRVSPSFTLAHDSWVKISP